MSIPTHPLPTNGETRLFEPIRAGSLQLKNRLIMAPLTRVRSGTDGIPGSNVVEYYRQRASFGAIITEGTWDTPPRIKHRAPWHRGRNTVWSA